MKGIMPNVVVYHKDADGYCSAAIAMMAGIDGTYIPMDYGEKSDAIAPLDSRVYMLDFCLQPFEHMDTLNKCCELHWIDHHKSALVAAAKANFEASGGQLTAKGLAACELTWWYFHPMEDMPDWVRLVGRYDVWDHRDSRTIPFHYGLLSHELDPNTGEGLALWASLADEAKKPGTGIETVAIVVAGGYILRYNQIRYANLAKTASFNLLFDGLKFVAFNALHTGSMVADSVWNHDIYDAILTFGWVKDHWTVGLYTDKPGVDVSEVASSHGGGGHRGAAGFQCDELPFGLPAIDWMGVDDEETMALDSM